MSKDYTDTIPRLASGDATPEVAVNDAYGVIEAALTELAGMTGGTGDTGGTGGTDLPSGGTAGQFLALRSGPTGDTGDPYPVWADVPAELPSGGTAGQFLSRTANGVVWADPPEGGGTGDTGSGGGTNVGGVNGVLRKFNPPKMADFTLGVSPGGPLTLIDDADLGLTFQATPVTGDKITCRTKALPTGDWSVTFGLNSGFLGISYGSVGLAVKDANNNQYVIFGLDFSRNQISTTFYNAAGGFNSNPFQYNMTQFTRFFKMSYSDSTKKTTFYVSWDGKNYTPIGTITNTVWSEVGLGFGLNHNPPTDGFFVNANCFNWEQSWS